MPLVYLNNDSEKALSYLSFPVFTSFSFPTRKHIKNGVWKFYLLDRILSVSVILSINTGSICTSHSVLCVRKGIIAPFYTVCNSGYTDVKYCNLSKLYSNFPAALQLESVFLGCNLTYQLLNSNTFVSWAFILKMCTNHIVFSIAAHAYAFRSLALFHKELLIITRD